MEATSLGTQPASLRCALPSPRDPGAPAIGQILCDGVLRSPVTIEGTCGQHKLEVSHARYQTLTRWVALAAALPDQLDISLARPIHDVTVTSFPPGRTLD